MEFIFSVGKKERHEVEVRERGTWFKKLLVKVDGEEKVCKATWAFSGDIIVPIGKKEKHELRVSPGFAGRYMIYVDGKPFRESATSVKVIEGEKSWIVTVIISILILLTEL